MARLDLRRFAVGMATFVRATQPERRARRSENPGDTAGRIRLTIVVAVASVVLIGGCGASTPASSSAPSGSGTSRAASAETVPALAGTWAIKETITKNPAPASWIGPIGDVDLRIWTITPTCASGPCDLDVVSTHVGAAPDTGIKLHFTYANGSYTNTYTYANDCTSTSAPVVKDAWTIVTVSAFTPALDGSLAISGTQHISATSSPAGTKAGCNGFDGVEYDLTGTPASSAPNGSASAAPTSGSPSPHARLASAIKADKSCARESTTRSVTATGSSKYTIINLTASTVSVFWIDYKGKREHWFDLASTDQATQATFKSHPWVVTDEGGRCLRLFKAPVTITIK